MKIKSWALLVLLATTGVIACGGDNPADPAPVVPQVPIWTDPEDVLHNIELAYNKRRIDWYNAVLDENFTFFLAPGDVGGNVPDSWNRADEIGLNQKLFDVNYTTLPCQSIFMDIRTEDGETWTEIIPESAPNEIWYSATLYYDFKFEISPNTYIPNPGSKATFIVRNAGTADAPHWQLVEMKDLGGSSLMSSAAGTEPVTWGSVKVMYR